MNRFDRERWDTMGKEALSRVEELMNTSRINELIHKREEDEKKKKLKEIKRAVGKERFIQLTTLLLESGLLAFLIGILVNQVTSLLTKYICPDGYSGWIIAILLFLIVVVFVGLILRNIRQFFNIGEENESK